MKSLQKMLSGNKVKILASGSFLPKKIVKNDDLDKNLNTNNEWIIQRTGITQRYIASESENPSEMGALAAIDSINKLSKIDASFSKSEIGLVIVATSTSEKIFPSTAAEICSKLGLSKDVIAFDINAACSGFLHGFVVANNIISSSKGRIKKALVIGSEKMSSIVDWNDRSTCVLFGDGAGALLLGSQEEDNSCESAGMIDYIIRSDGNLGEILYANKNENCIKMNGKEVFLTASKELEKVIRDICERNSVNISDIKNFFIHQSNARILKFLSENLGVDQDKILVSIDIHANTSAASVPLLINENFNKLEKDSLIVVAAVGAGMVWGATLVKI